MPLTLTAALTDTVGITDSFVAHSTHPRARADTVGITDLLHTVWRFPPTPDTVGITETLAVTGNFIQYDSWRPVARPDNGLVIICRTPAGEHDSHTGLTHMTFWTVHPDGTKENPVLLSPAHNGFGWVSYGHPEWSPDGNTVLFWIETATSYKLVLMDSSGFGQL